MHVSDPTLALFLLSVYVGLVAKTNVGIVSELSDGSPGCCDGPISQQGIKVPWKGWSYPVKFGVGIILCEEQGGKKAVTTCIPVKGNEAGGVQQS